MELSIKTWLAILFSGLMMLLADCTPTFHAIKNRDPQRSLFFSDDINNFWRAFDLAENLSDENSLPVYEATFFKKASIGLREFWWNYELDKRGFIGMVHSCRAYFSAARNNSLSGDDYKKRVLEIFKKLQKIYLDARFPDIYFVIGGFKSGGTVSSENIIIGMEFWSLPDGANYNLPFTWMKNTIRKPSNLPFTIAHELVHFQQYRKEFLKTLLGRSLIEGGADFIGKLISGGINNEYLHKYADPIEKELWLKFKEDMKTNDQESWIYNLGKIKDTPADLGYYVGYKICESYYNNATNKKKAIKDIITLKDPMNFLALSQYPKKFP